MPHHVPKTTKEAMNMVQRGWLFLLKKNPAIFAPLTFWMFFGGFIFLYNYVDADKFTVKEAKPLSQVTSPSFSIIPQAVAAQPGGQRGDIPITFNKQVWGYEDTTLIVKADKYHPILLVFDKITQKVYEVEFTGRDYRTKMQMRK